jgi:hypothetical protein
MASGALKPGKGSRLEATVENVAFIAATLDTIGDALSAVEAGTESAQVAFNVFRQRWGTFAEDSTYGDRTWVSRVYRTGEYHVGLVLQRDKLWLDLREYYRA